jgi:hypothetical protein
MDGGITEGRTMSSKTEQAIEAGRKITLSMIESDLISGNCDALYFATEKQIVRLIDTGRIDEDFYSRWDQYQEDMRCMMSEI